MRKITQIIAFLSISIFVASCSSDGDGDGGGSGGSNSSNFKFNGTNIPLTTVEAQKSENSIFIYASSDDETEIELLFNKFGNLERISVVSMNPNYSEYFNYKHFNSNYFDFNLISINENTKRVKVSFSGKLYEEDDDLTSDSITITGSFEVNYVDVVPFYAGIGTSCKIGGSNWYDTDSWDEGFFDVQKKVISDDEHMLTFKFEQTTIPVGNYTFSPTSANRVYLSKFDTTTKTYIHYNCTGSFKVDSNLSATNFRIIEGTFSFTAVNPSNSSQEIQVTNGTFKNLF
jgi:hypothetical protein